MTVTFGKIIDVSDPRKLGRAKLMVPAFGLETITDWAWRIQLPGVFFGPRVNDTVLVLAIPSGVKETLFWLGPIDNAPDGVSSSPRADDYSVEEYPQQKIIDFGFAEIVADASGNQLIISTLPKGNPARITLDANTPQIIINPGGFDVLFDQAGPRLAMVGDRVVVQTADGPASGTITSGSVPAQSRFPE
jgi:hypothetical protein